LQSGVILNLLFEECEGSRVEWYPPAGLEPNAKTPEKQATSCQSGTNSGTVADAGKVEALAAELMKPSPTDRERLSALLAGGR